MRKVLVGQLFATPLGKLVAAVNFALIMAAVAVETLVAARFPPAITNNSSYFIVPFLHTVTLHMYCNDAPVSKNG